MLIQEALEWGYRRLIGSSDSARLDAELLLAHVLNQPTTFLLAHDEQKISSIKRWRYGRLIRKRKEGIPLAYLTGHKEFYFLDLKVSPAVLIPRPDTEILVEAVIQYLTNLKSGQPPLLLDIGTGSGCIPIAVTKNVPGLSAIATDLSGSALKIAKHNIQKYGLGDRIRLIQSDLTLDVPPEMLEGREVIVTANLPYIPTALKLTPETRFEPALALYGGQEGLDLYKRLTKELEPLRPKALFFELFEFQIALLSAHIKGYRMKEVRTMTGEARLVVLERMN